MPPLPELKQLRKIRISDRLKHILVITAPSIRLGRTNRSGCSKKPIPRVPRLSLNQWALSGTWKVGAESAVLQTAPGRIVFRFHARDLHLVLGPTKVGKPVRFTSKLDGALP